MMMSNMVNQSKPCPLVANIKDEVPVGTSLCYPFLPAVHALDRLSGIKELNILSLNKLYTGIGVHNDNGGIEFYSSDYQACLKEYHNGILDDMRRQESALEKEAASLVGDVSYGEVHHTEWVAELNDLESRYVVLRERIIAFVDRVRHGLLSQDEKASARKRFRSEKKALSTAIRKCREKLTAYISKKERFDKLMALLPQLKCKIAERSRTISTVSTVTIGQPSLLQFPLVKGTQSSSCCLFFDMFDYFSYVFLLSVEGQSDLPRGCDSLVMNDVRNFPSLMDQSEGYDHIFCLFPNTVLGETMSETVIQKYCSRAVSKSSLYAGYASIHEYANSIYDYKKHVSI